MSIMSCFFVWYKAGMIIVFCIIGAYNSVGESQSLVMDASEMSDADRKLCLGWTNTSNSGGPPPEIVQLHGPYTINDFICPHNFTLTCNAVGENLLWYLVHPQVNDEPLFTFLTNDHTANNDCSEIYNGQEGTADHRRVKHITRMSENIYIDFWGVLINITVDAGTGIHRCNSSLIVSPFIKEASGITLGCRSHCPSTLLGSGAIVQSLLKIKFTMTPTRPKSLNYSWESDISSSINISESNIDIQSCNAIKIYWDPPSNHKETMVDHYELIVGTQHMVVIDTEWIFIPRLADLRFLSEESYATLVLNVSVSAVDNCGQKGEPSTLHNIHLTCNNTQHDLCIPTAELTSSRIAITIILTSMILSFLIIMMLFHLYIVTVSRSVNRSDRTSRAKEESSDYDMKHDSSTNAKGTQTMNIEMT